MAYRHFPSLFTFTEACENQITNGEKETKMKLLLLIIHESNAMIGSEERLPSKKMLWCCGQRENLHLNQPK